MECAERLQAAGKGFRFHVRDAQRRLDVRLDEPRQRDRVPSAFLELEQGDAWVKLNNVADVDGRYASLLAEVLDDLSPLMGRDLERFYTGDDHAARYSADLEPLARLFELGPGDGVHHPPVAPPSSTAGWRSRSSR